LGFDSLLDWRSRGSISSCAAHSLRVTLASLHRPLTRLVPSCRRCLLENSYAAADRSYQNEWSAAAHKPSTIAPVSHRITNTTGTGSSRNASYNRSILPLPLPFIGRISTYYSKRQTRTPSHKGCRHPYSPNCREVSFSDTPGLEGTKVDPMATAGGGGSFTTHQ
jgi:hypothetical protein